LSPEQARELLLRVTPRIGDRADELARFCEYLPEALRTSASFIAERSDFSPTDLPSRMRSVKRRLNLTGMEAPLAATSDLLSTELRLRWFELAVFPSSFDYLGAAAVWQLEPDAAKDTLSELLRYSPVQWDSAMDRYQLRVVGRDFTSSHISESERCAAEGRHAAHYKDVAAYAHRFYLQGGEAARRGLALFDIEWENIRAVKLGLLHMPQRVIPQRDSPSNSVPSFSRHTKLIRADGVARTLPWLLEAVSACA
jgi:hypothetical protein